MDKEKNKNARLIVFSDGSTGNMGDFPVAVIYTQTFGTTKETIESGLVVDPIFTGQIYGNLYGRVMTLVEATTDPQRLKAVKDVFSKELLSWSGDVHNSAREIANGGNSGNNLYTRR